MPRITGKLLNEKFNIGAAHALYRENGRWYMLLERFPGALFDRNSVGFGYVVFNSKAEYENSPFLKHGLRLNITGKGISGIPGYKSLPSN
ncbi:MAG: hypothetical protein AAB667_00035 [Patescibacteria group bacterium]